jgi:acarbose 7IV-phosphotransferase
MTELDVFVVGGVGVDTPRASARTAAAGIGLDQGATDPAICGPHRQRRSTGLSLPWLRTHFADVIGTDFEGELVLAHYAKAGLSFDHRIHPSGTRRSVNLVDTHGKRLFLYDGRHPPEMTVNPELYRAALGRTRHVHVSLINWTRYALAEAIDAGLSTSTDLHNWDGRSEYRQDFAYGAELVFLSTNALGTRIEEVAEDILARGRAKAVVAMAGGDGSYLQLPGWPLRHVPPVALPAEQVVDTNGAGDSYVAGFLYAYLSGKDWSVCTKAGSLAGTHAVRKAGTHTSFITADELDRALSAIPNSFTYFSSMRWTPIVQSAPDARCAATIGP